MYVTHLVCNTLATYVTRFVLPRYIRTNVTLAMYVILAMCVTLAISVTHATYVKQEAVSRTKTKHTGGSVPHEDAPMLSTVPVAFDDNDEVIVEKVNADAVAVSPKKRKVEAHEIDRDAGTSMPFADLEKIAQALFLKQADFAIFSTYAVGDAEVRDLLEVVKVEATEPLVCQAVAKENVPPEKLRLVPFSEALTPMDADKVFKRPKQLHPALRNFKAMASVSAAGDAHEYEIRTPLLGKGGEHPSPYWVVLHVEGEGNMMFKEYKIPVEHPTPEIKGKGAKKKAKMKGCVEVRTCANVIGIE